MLKNPDADAACRDETKHGRLTVPGLSQKVNHYGTDGAVAPHWQPQLTLPRAAIRPAFSVL